MKKSTVIIFVY